MGKKMKDKSKLKNKQGDFVSKFVPGVRAAMWVLLALCSVSVVLIAVLWLFGGEGVDQTMLLLMFGVVVVLGTTAVWTLRYKDILGDKQLVCQRLLKKHCYHIDELAKVGKRNPPQIHSGLYGRSVRLKGVKSSVTIAEKRTIGGASLLSMLAERTRLKIPM